MASKFCTKCGSPTIAGKRFCGKCGQPIAQPDSSPELTGKTTDTEPIQQASSLPDAVPQAAVLTSSQTPSKEVRVLSDSDVNVEIPSSQPQNNRPVEPTPVLMCRSPSQRTVHFPHIFLKRKHPTWLISLLQAHHLTMKYRLHRATSHGGAKHYLLAQQP